MEKIVMMFVLVFALGCSNMNDLHQPYLDRGEVIYTEKVESLFVLSGRNRVELKWQIFSDISIKKARIIWTNKFDLKDSLDIDISVTSGVVDDYSKVISGLEEGDYIFEVRTFDNYGNNSIPVTSIGKVLGANYLNGLTNRGIVSHSITGTTVNFVMSSNLPEDYIYSEFSFFDASGVAFNHVLLSGDSRFFSIDTNTIDVTSGVMFRSVYLPFGNGIDLFNTEFLRYNID